MLYSPYVQYTSAVLYSLYVHICSAVLTIRTHLQCCTHYTYTPAVLYSLYVHTCSAVRTHYAHTPAATRGTHSCAAADVASSHNGEVVLRLQVDILHTHRYVSTCTHPMAWCEVCKCGWLHGVAASMRTSSTSPMRVCTSLQTLQTCQRQTNNRTKAYTHTRKTHTRNMQHTHHTPA